MYLKRLLILILFILCTSQLFADKLKDIKTSGILKAGVKYDFEPFGFLDESNNVVGFDIDLLKYIGNQLNVKVEFIKVTSKNRIELLEKGAVDIVAASMTHKVSRDATIDFSISYFFDGQSFLARKNSKKRNAEGFNGKYVGAIEGSTSGENLRKIAPKAQVIYFAEYSDAIKALKEGKIDAITTDLVWCTTQANKSEGVFKVIDDVISFEPYGMGLPENESNFRDQINLLIQEAVKDGSYAKYYQKWFKEDPKRLPEVWPE
ncbi:MAG: transporter substrate-binding domain-containing protein [Campylobacterales bacterium]|nr:transporter substrate-binding domain-containing protein [Campylobacterales bacterium]